MFAELVIEKGLSGSTLQALLKKDYGLKPSVQASLKSVYHLRQLIDLMNDGLGGDSWTKESTSDSWSDQHPEPIEFWRRDIVEAACWMLRQPAFEEYLSYTPKRCFS